MRSIYAFLVAVVLFGLVPVQAFAEDKPIHVILDGQEVVFPSAPRMEDGTTLVPFRALFEAVEMTVVWDEDTQTITAESTDKKLQLRIGSAAAQANGQTVQLDTPPQLIEGVAYVPLRFVGEALDYLVDYQTNDTSIRITLRTSSLRLPLSRDPDSLDPAVSNNNISYEPLIGLFEGLVHSTENGSIVPAAASSWDISEDRKSYTFHIRPDAVWSNGDPVTAQGFADSWKRVADLNASLGADFLSHIDQVKAYLSGTAKWEETGIRVKSDKTLEIHLEQPLPYFLQLMSEISLVPIHSSARKQPTWNNDPLHFVSNGPFTLESWKHGEEIILKKNLSYHSSSEICFPKVRFVITNDVDHPASKYLNGELDWLGSPFSDLAYFDAELLEQDETSNLFVQSNSATYYYLFNLTQKPFNNVKVRKAFMMSVNNEVIVDRFFEIDDVYAAHGIVPHGIKGVQSDFREEQGEPSNPFNAAEARELLKEGLKEEGITVLPSITVLVNEGAHYKIALEVIKMWKENLGVQARIQIKDAKTWSEYQKSLHYQIARAGYIADFNDPATFLNMWSSESTLNHSGFKDKTYDELLQKANDTSDAHERMRILADAEKYLLEDQAVLMPLYYYPRIWAQKKNIHNIVVNFNGTIDYTRSYYKP